MKGSAVISSTLAGLIISHVLWRWKVYPALKRKVVTLLRQHSLGRLQHFGSSPHEQLSEQTLLAILQTNAPTQYGQKYNFPAIQSEQQYRETLPLIFYEDIRDLILRWCDEGESNLLSVHKILFVATSSGTTGHPKWIPITRGAVSSMQSVVSAARGVTERTLRLLDRSDPLRKVLVVSYHPAVSQQTKTGIPVGPLSQARASMPWWMSTIAEFCSPPSAMPSWTDGVLHFESNLLLHILFALLTPDLEHMVILFGSIFHHFLLLLEQQFFVLAEVIRTGQSRRCDLFANNIPSHLLDRIDHHLLSQNSLSWRQDRAQTMDSVEDFAGIVPRMWPSLEFVTSSMSGAFAVYEPDIRRYLGDVPLLGAVYMSSESAMGFQYNPQGHYAFHPEAAFFEFIPESQISQAQPSTLLLEQLERNERYEVVVTTASGLYRYRLGDVIQVEDVVEEGVSRFPLFSVLYRTGCILDAYGEKTTESHVEQALERVGERVGIQLLDYTTFLQTSASPVYYQLFVEWRAEEGTALDREQLTHLVDEALQDIHPAYGGGRTLGKLGCLQLVMVTEGSFREFKEVLMAQGTAPMQVKIPRLLKNSKHTAFFLDRQIH